MAQKASELALELPKVLIITYYWPPAGGPGVQRWLYFATFMREFGVEPVIYTPKNPHYPVRDPGLQGRIPADLKIYRKKIWEPYGLAGWISKSKTRQISSGILNRKKPSALERALRWVRGNLFVPDPRKYWVRPSVGFLQRVLEEEGIETVITTGPPHSLHLIGLHLKSRAGVRWIADFRDPWTSIGYHEALYPGARARTRHKELEAMVLNAADAVITTSAHTKREFSRITRRPIHVITNGYLELSGRNGQPEGPFTLAHIGSLLSGRNPESLWKALKNLLDSREGFGEDLQIELTGLVSEEVLESIKGHGLEGYLRLNPYLPHAQALERQRRAQVLLLIEINSGETAGIIPGKLFEYMAASRPILAIGPAGWEAGSLLEDSGCGAAFGYGERESIEAQLLQWYDAYRKGKLVVSGRGVEKYHRRALTERLIREVLWA